MTQSIVVQIGQCGNQIGHRFWDLALREQSINNKNGLYDETMSSFFRNVDTRQSDSNASSSNSYTGKIKSLKARSVLIDMEEGVVSRIMNGSLGELFDHRQFITDVSGCGNNWAVGHKYYGTQYHDKILETVRRTTEFCDHLECFFILHSMGGGTGSGVGTYVLHLLHDEYPEIYRFVTAVYPSSDDDVITSPYNSVLAMNKLTECADCVIPVENQSLLHLVDKIQSNTIKLGKSNRLYDSSSKSSPSDNGCGVVAKDEKPFNEMNSIVANMLLNITSSSRFGGSLNVDLNEITMNLVPFPKMHYLTSSQSPLCNISSSKTLPRKLDEMFSDAFSQQYQLINADPKSHLFLASSLLVRGNVAISDIRRNIEKLRSQLKFVHWNEEGWKTGLCSVPPVYHSSSLLALSNNTCIKNNFMNLRDRFVKLYKRKAHIHHYTQIDGMELNEFSESLDSLDNLISNYNDLDIQSNQPKESIPRLKIVS